MDLPGRLQYEAELSKELKEGREATWASGGYSAALLISLGWSVS